MVLSSLRRDRIIVLAALIALSASAWGYLLTGAGMRVIGPSVGMPMGPAWTGGYAALMFVMWASMMLAMMLPSAAPAILLVATLMHECDAALVLGSTALFVLGYAMVWVGFSFVATSAQWSLGSAGWLSTRMASNSSTLTGLLLAGAGAYQWTRFKRACLSRCQSPTDVLLQYWRRGVAGPFLAGARHGTSCLGCCWALMGLLFVGGVMNPGWVALLSLLVLVEKVSPFGRVVARSSGALLVASGVVTLLMTTQG